VRIHISLSPNTEILPFDYQHYLTGTFHKWIGENNIHDEISLYSIGWLDAGAPVKNGINFPKGAAWFISFWDDELMRRTMSGAIKDPDAFCGMKVTEIKIQETPEFTGRTRFAVSGPILIRKYDKNPNGDHLLYDNPEAGHYLTETMKRKLIKAGLNHECTIRFDTSYSRAKTKLVKINNISNRASICPVIVEGDPEAVKFAWNVGVGHCTGSAFGALR